MDKHQDVHSAALGPFPGCLPLEQPRSARGWLPLGGNKSFHHKAMLLSEDKSLLSDILKN